MTVTTVEWAVRIAFTASVVECDQMQRFSDAKSFINIVQGWEGEKRRCKKSVTVVKLLFIYFAFR